MTPEQLQAIRERAEKADARYWNPAVLVHACEDIRSLLAEVERLEMLAKQYLNDGIVAMLQRDTAQALAKQLAQPLHDFYEGGFLDPPSPPHQSLYSLADKALAAYNAATGEKA